MQSCSRMIQHNLVFFSALALSLDGVHANLLVVLLEGGHVLAGLGELAFLHALSDVPVDEGTLGVHLLKEKEHIFISKNKLAKQ
jgi:hypothetical protein